MNKYSFYQRPYNLERDDRYATMLTEMGLVGMALYDLIYEKIRMGGGLASIDELCSLRDPRSGRAMTKRVKRIISQFGLFRINQLQQVSIVDISARLIRESADKYQMSFDFEEYENMD